MIPEPIIPPYHCHCGRPGCRKKDRAWICVTCDRIERQQAFENRVNDPAKNKDVFESTPSPLLVEPYRVMA